MCVQVLCRQCFHLISHRREIAGSDHNCSCSPHCSPCIFHPHPEPISQSDPLGPKSDICPSPDQTLPVAAHCDHTLSRSLSLLRAAFHTLAVLPASGPQYILWPVTPSRHSHAGPSSADSVHSLHREAPPALCLRPESPRPHLKSRWVLMPMVLGATLLGAKASPWRPQVRVLLLPLPPF